MIPRRVSQTETMSAHAMTSVRSLAGHRQSLDPHRDPQGRQRADPPNQEDAAGDGTDPQDREHADRRPHDLLHVSGRFPRLSITPLAEKNSPVHPAPISSRPMTIPAKRFSSPGLNSAGSRRFLERSSHRISGTGQEGRRPAASLSLDAIRRPEPGVSGDPQDRPGSVAAPAPAAQIYARPSPPATLTLRGLRSDDTEASSTRFAHRRSHRSATLRQAMLGEALTSPASPHPLVAKRSGATGTAWPSWASSPGWIPDASFTDYRPREWFVRPLPRMYPLRGGGLPLGEFLRRSRAVHDLYSGPKADPAASDRSGARPVAAPRRIAGRSRA